jgi:hypothetical protein
MKTGNKYLVKSKGVTILLLVMTEISNRGINNRDHQRGVCFCPLSRVTFKDIQKIVQLQSVPEQSSITTSRKQTLLDLGTPKQHRQKHIKTKGSCCFNHVMGPPRKDGHDIPLLPYRERYMIHFKTISTSG